AGVAASAALGTFPEIRLQAAGEPLAAFLASPHLLNLRELRLGFAKVDAEGARAVARSPSLANLQKLDLSGGRFRDQALADFAEARPLGQLRTLDLGNVRVGRLGIGPAGISALFRSPNFPSLVGLELLNNRVGDAGAEGIAAGRLLGQLQWLGLRSCK